MTARSECTNRRTHGDTPAHTHTCTHTWKMINRANVFHNQWMFQAESTVELWFHAFLTLHCNSTWFTCSVHDLFQVSLKYAWKILIIISLSAVCQGIHQPFKPSGHQRRPLPEHGEDLQQLHCGPGESGDHLHGGAPWPVLPQGKDSEQRRPNTH